MLMAKLRICLLSFCSGATLWKLLNGFLGSRVTFKRFQVSGILNAKSLYNHGHLLSNIHYYNLDIIVSHNRCFEEYHF